MNDFIRIRGAREHNLKNLDLDLPRNQITVMTGLSGSGKSSLAFDTIYAEGQRRYVESLSAYARQFLEQLKKPELDVIEGLSPAIAIDQKSVGHNPRSTVGTITEISDFLRLLYARVGVPMCPDHHLPVTAMSLDRIVEKVLSWPKGTKVMILAPMVQGKKGEFLTEFQKWLKKGYVKARVDGNFILLDQAKKLAKTKAHTIDLVVDQLPVQENFRSRIIESLNSALSMANGQVVVETFEGDRKTFSITAACPECGLSFPELEPRFFSFNNPRGACVTCSGLGTTDVQELQQIGEGEVGASVFSGVKYEAKNKTSSGKASSKTNSEDEEDLEESEWSLCPDCHGTRLNPLARNVLIEGKGIHQVSDLPIDELQTWIENVKFSGNQSIVANKIQAQISGRTQYLQKVGVGYLSLSRPSRTLSGGESQRIRLATQVGSSLIGVLYVMDEPSIGLHPRDQQRMIEVIQELRNRGNSVLLVEHDEETIRQSDFVVDLGPRAGKLGGEILAQGTPAEIAKNPNSLTGLYLSGKKHVALSKIERQGTGKFLEVIGARGNNLQNVNLKIPIGTFTVITGVSGSGKSTLIIDTLYKALARDFYQASAEPSPYKKILGTENFDKIIEINQKPIGRTPRSTPATYVGLLPIIRETFAGLPDSKVRGYGPGRFSFNLKGGRCEACGGHGQIRMEMHFLADVFVTCDTCLGRRYNRETMMIRLQSQQAQANQEKSGHPAGKSIADVLEMNVEEAFSFFKNYPAIRRKLETLMGVGLDYMTLGQSSVTLSGGEAQRIKLSRELSKRGTGRTLYILDEPTTGLHFEDVKKLLELLNDLVEQGNTVVVIEHHVDVMKSADWIVDIGPEGGKNGGEIVFAGRPSEMSARTQASARSITAQFLRNDNPPL